MNNRSVTPVFLVDSHVHFYPCFQLPAFLNAALRNFRAQAATTGHGDNFVGVLLLTETHADDYFHAWRQLAQQAEQSQQESAVFGDGSERWCLHLLEDEQCTLRALSPSGESIYLIAGRQVITTEGLEVLALMVDASFEDGLTIDKAIDNVRAKGGVPLIPWGFGKWWGRRGAILSALLQVEEGTRLLLGDNSARPRILSYPSHFKLGCEHDYRILPGSDPLPFTSEFWRPGSVGAMIHEPVSLETPAAELRRILLDPECQVSPYMHLEKSSSFVKNQVRMQIRKRVTKDRVAA